MLDLQKTPSVVEITSEDAVKQFELLRSKFREVQLEQDRQQRVIMIYPRSPREATAVLEAANHALRIIWEHDKEPSEHSISALVELYLEGQKCSEFTKVLAQDNAKLRSRYFQEVQTYTAVQIHDLLDNDRPKNRSEPASRWKREKRVFAVPYNHTEHFPRFQFDEGRPRPIIKDALKRLPDDMSPWQVAFWFRSGNGWLGGMSPEEALEDTRGVLNAADRLSDPAIG